MKVNTDGVLLATLTEAQDPEHILDIGTGTGVMSLILAQRFPAALIHAVEIEETAAFRASENFKKSTFANRLKVYSQSFEEYFSENPEQQYDLIISNPPFFIDSLKSGDTAKSIARHTDKQFFEKLLLQAKVHLKLKGTLSLIIPVELVPLIQKLAGQNHLYLKNQIDIHSFAHSMPHREILSLGFEPAELRSEKFVIYERPKEYSAEYVHLLKDFFTIF